MEFLIGLIRLYVYVNPVAETSTAPCVFWAVAFRKELEPEFKMPLRFSAIRMQMGCT